MGASNWVYVDVEEVVAETAAALLLRIDGEEVWIPKSQIESGGEDYDAHDVDLTIGITEYIAKQKGLESKE